MKYQFDLLHESFLSMWGSNGNKKQNFLTVQTMNNLSRMTWAEVSTWSALSFLGEPLIHGIVVPDRGSIGGFQRAAFNVAIRSIQSRLESNLARFALGLYWLACPGSELNLVEFIVTVISRRRLGAGIIKQTLAQPLVLLILVPAGELDTHPSNRIGILTLFCTLVEVIARFSELTVAEGVARRVFAFSLADIFHLMTTEGEDGVPLHVGAILAGSGLLRGLLRGPPQGLNRGLIHGRHGGGAHGLIRGLFRGRHGGGAHGIDEFAHLRTASVAETSVSVALDTAGFEQLCRGMGRHSRCE